MSLYGATKAALNALTLDLNKELAPLGITSILCEGDISGNTSMVQTYLSDVAAFGGTERAYATAEAAARHVGGILVANDDPGRQAARIIADACTTPKPSVRYPADAQTLVDQMRRLSDEDYLRLCAGEDVEEILNKHHAVDTPWAMR
jgi:NAD(P)-dependent dehydrogenase (short-subunit alcohol dehydrogenase family)